MGSPWAVVNVAGAADRNPPTIDPTQTRYLTRGVITQSWGSQPGTAEFRYTAEIDNPAVSIATALAPIAPGTYVELSLPGHTFAGIALADVASDSPGGKERAVHFADLREYLSWDQVYGSFNRGFTQQVLNSATGRFEGQRWYAHVLPANWATGLVTFTSSPYTAEQVCDFLFGASTVHTSWLRDYHPDMAVYPVYEMDFMGGSTLARALLAVSEKLGLLFTLKQNAGFTLQWRRKGQLIAGDVSLPWASSPFPVDSNGLLVPPVGVLELRRGVALSGYPAVVRIVGDRNLYQTLNLVLVKDWAPGWEVFWDEELFINWVYLNGADASGSFVAVSDPIVGMQRAKAYALGMTVGQVALALGSTYVDNRRWGGKARWQLPAILYIRDILFRAFRLPDMVMGISSMSLEITSKLFFAVSHDASGVMTADLTFPTDGQGYVIAQCAALNSAGFSAVRPEVFNVTEWLASSVAWGIQSFAIDNSPGQIPFIIAEHKVCNVQSAVKSVDGFGVIDNTWVPAAVPVHACLTLAAERYVYTAGTGYRTGLENVQGLRREVVRDESSNSILGELPYIDGQYPNDKAAALANSLLLRQYSYASGSLQRVINPGDVGTVLNGMLDRVVVELDASGGITETIDFSKERTWAAFVPERQYDRFTLGDALAQGQGELRQQQLFEADLAVTYAANPQAVSTLRRALHLVLGGNEPLASVQVQSGSGTLKMGTPLWRTSAQGTPVMPSATTSSHTVLVGVTTRDAEAVDANKQIRVAREGRALARAQGPIAVGDGLSLSPGNDFLVKAMGAAGLITALNPIGDSSTKLVEVQFAGGSSTGGVWS